MRVPFTCKISRLLRNTAVILAAMCASRSFAQDVPQPLISLTNTEDKSGPPPYRVYTLQIVNAAAFPNEMFAPAPDLPPCGLNTNASRTWVNLYTVHNGQNRYNYGYCGLTSNQSLGALKVTSPLTDLPAAVFLELNDRRTATIYRSQMLSFLPGPAISPVWKKHYSVPDTALSLDADGDGLLGWQEAAFGTNPFDRNSAPNPVVRRAGAATFLDWFSRKGAREQIQTASNLQSWSPLGPARYGTGGITSVSLDPLTPRRYFRIQALVAEDPDQDGLNSMEEGLLGSDAFVPDTDADTFTDFDEWTRGWNPVRAELNRFWRDRSNIDQVAAQADPDGDGFDNRSESMFGTDPKSRTSAPGITIVPGPGGTILLRWNTVAGIPYQLQSGTGTGPWAAWGAPITGTDQTAEVSITPSALGASRFFRLAALTPGDADGDTLDDYEEGLFGTDRTQADTDRDGASDATEILTLQTDPLRGVQAPVITAFPASVSTATAAVSGTAAAGETISASNGGAPITTTAAADGAFTLNVPLQTNRLNRIALFAGNAAGQTGPARTIEILHDAQPPDVFLDFPGQNAQLYTPAATIAGRVADALSGYQGLTVTVNSQPANVIIGIGTNGTFERAAVPLVIGENQITVTARDTLGNTTTKSILVYRADPTGGASIVATAGSGQSGIIHRLLPQPVEIEVRNAAGAISPGVPVTFKVIRSDGRIVGTVGATGGGLTFQTVADATGRARAFWTLGGDAGCGNNRIEVTTPGVNGVAYFCASAHPGPAAQINIGSGNNQIIETGGTAHELLRAWVSDGCNGVAGVPITFTVTGGGGKVNGQPAATIITSATGHAAVTFQLGPFTGNHTVEATFPGYTGSPAVFTLRGLERQPDQPTSFTGIVQDNAGQPIGGATALMRINGTWGNSVTTAPDGTFTMPDLAASGQMKLLVSGSGATLLGGQSIPPGSFPSLEFDLVAVPNTVNSLTGPVLLPKLDPANSVRWDGATDVAITCKGIEGLQFTIRAGSMTRADGTKPSPASPAFLSINQVHHDDVPMPMPDGASPPFAWTFQPGGATFNPPVEIRYPNMSGLAPGTVAYFLTYDHAVEQFRIISSGHVTNDGAHVVTDAGSGLTLSGWGCNCPPYSVTGDCEKCDGTPDECDCEATDERAREGPPDAITITLDSNLDRRWGGDPPATQENPFHFWSISANSAPVEEAGSGLLPEDFVLLDIPTGADLDKAGKCGYKLRLDVGGQRVKLFKAHGQAPGWHILGQGEFGREVDPSDLGAGLTVAERQAGRITLLVAGEAPGNATLTARLRKGTLVAAESAAIHIRFHAALDMYERQHALSYDLNQTVVDFPRAPVAFGNGSYALAPGSIVARHWGDTQNVIVFIHGFNMGEDNKREDSTIMFKRLYWAGYRGRFASYFWPCVDSAFWAGVFGGFDPGFNRSEFIAFKYGAGFRNYLNSLSGRVHVAAHSQGNIVASEALKTGASPVTYLMMQAAVPVICYDPATTLLDVSILQRENNLPSFVYKTADQADRGQADRGYQGYFSNIGAGPRIVNMFNVHDTVTGAVWLANQALGKPAFSPATGYEYDTHADRPPGQAHVVEPIGPFGSVFRSLGDPHEIMAFATRSISRSVGASDFAGGPVDSKVNLTTFIDGIDGGWSGGQDLRDRHSAQFVFPFHRTYAFYQRVLAECGIPYNP